MKRFIIIISIFILFITVVNVNAQGYGKWKILNEGLDRRVNTIDFVNENVGWIAGNRTLFKTEDGGDFWNPIPIDENWEFQEIDFVDESLGWAAVWDFVIEKLIILKTIDGGKTWLIQKKFTNTWIDKLFAIDDSTVYAVVGEKIVLRTTDGGNNWNNVSPNLTNIHIYSAWFVDTETWGITGSYQDSTDQGLFLSTVDGGKTWDEKIVPDFVAMVEPQIINDSTILFIGMENWDSKNFLCKTTDTLNSWVILAEDVSAYHAFVNNEIHAIVSGDNLLKSTDGGNTWDMIQTIWESNSISFININVGFIYGDRAFYRTMDGGEYWKMEHFTCPLTDIFFIDENNGFAVGNFCIRYWHGNGAQTIGGMFQTDAGGKTWKHNFTKSFTPRSLQYLNDNIGYTSGRSGGGRGSRPAWIFKTTDAGANWAQVFKNNPDSLGFKFLLNDTYFINEVVGWSVGSGFWADDSSGAAILGTKDGGVNWDLVWKYPNTDVYEYSLNSIQSVNNTTWAVGESGLIVKYTEQDQWQVQNTITDLPLAEVFFSDQQHGWIAGGYFDEDNVFLKLFRTKDSGQSWQDIPDFNYEINDIFFADSLHGWAVVADTSDRRFLIETQDGGDNWTVQIDDLPLNAIHFKDGFGWAVGDNGLLLRCECITWIVQNTSQIYPKLSSVR